MKLPYTVIAIILVFSTSLLNSCEEDFDIALKNNQEQLIVEGYINNVLPLYNYVILGRSQGYYESGFQNIAVSGATVTITEGTLLADNTYLWNAASKKQLKEARLPALNNTLLPGVYFDTTLITDSAHALLGVPGKHYLLEITSGENHYSAITALLPTTTIDSLTSGGHYIDNRDTLLKSQLTVHFKDPDTLGDSRLHYWWHSYTRNNFGWGGLAYERYISGTDDLVNGQYIHLTHSNGFEINDSLQYYLINVERKVYNFWNSYNKARSNGGPFSTPVKLQNTISGENVIGCFSGFSISTKAVWIR
jgi:hypothetical protein